jgi:hypothetical protein
MNRDIVAATVLMAVAFSYYRMADALPRSMLSDNVGADGFPKLLATALFLLSLVMLIMGLFKRRPVVDAEAREKRAHEKQAALRAAGMITLGVFYLIAVPWIGYPLAVGLLIAAVLFYFKEAFSWKVAVTAGVGGIFFWVFFVMAMQIPMPMGFWPKLFSGGMTP